MSCTIRNFPKKVVQSYNPCFSYPCLNSGTCYSINSLTYGCICSNSYTGTNCQTAKGNIIQLKINEKKLVKGIQFKLNCFEFFVLQTLHIEIFQF